MRVWEIYKHKKCTSHSPGGWSVRVNGQSWGGRVCHHNVTGQASVYTMDLGRASVASQRSRGQASARAGPGLSAVDSVHSSFYPQSASATASSPLASLHLWRWSSRQKQLLMVLLLHSIKIVLTFQHEFGGIIQIPATGKSELCNKEKNVCTFTRKAITWLRLSDTCLFHRYLFYWCLIYLEPMLQYTSILSNKDDYSELKNLFMHRELISCVSQKVLRT